MASLEETSTCDWYDALVELAEADSGLFAEKPAPGVVHETIAEEESRFREIETKLARQYGTPRLGNKFDPVDELVYIILSRKTREEAYQASFQALKKRFESWDEVLLAEQSAVFELVDSGGLGEKKTRSIVGALAELDSRFGACTLEPTRSWTDEKLFRFLCGLPEVGPKSARCIMMYSLDRKVFPVDTHVGRVLSRIRPFNALGADLSGKNHKKLQKVLPPLIPPDLRYSLHVNLIAHGRAICKFQRPRCDDCCIRKGCIHGLWKSPA